MARQQMPKELEELLFQIDDPQVVEEIQGKWMEYTAANERYERAYPEQFANLVQANNTFKENKTIPTPPEQMREYTDMIRDEINEKLHEKSHRDKEQLYDLNEPQVEDTGQKSFDEFKLTFLDMEQQVEPQQDKGKDEREKNDAEKTNDEKATSFNFELLFHNLDDVTLEEPTKEDMELDRDDYELELE